MPLMYLHIDFDNLIELDCCLIVSDVVFIGVETTGSLTTLTSDNSFAILET